MDFPVFPFPHSSQSSAEKITDVGNAMLIRMEHPAPPGPQCQDRTYRAILLASRALWNHGQEKDFPCHLAAYEAPIGAANLIEPP